MQRYRSPLTMSALLTDGPPVRLRDLEAITGLSRATIRRDVASGDLVAYRRRGARNTHVLVQRADAIRWLSQLGFNVFPVEHCASSIDRSALVKS